jgi:hypothetical protein
MVPATALAAITLRYKFIVGVPRPLDACIEQRPGLYFKLVLCDSFVCYHSSILGDLFPSFCTFLWFGYHALL